MKCFSVCAVLLAGASAREEAPGNEDALISEYNDESMGVAFSMVDNDHWTSTKWGVLPAPRAYASWAQSYVSIATKKTDMSVYRRRSHGLVLHIAPQYNFWKYFQVIAKGDGKGHIVGGPGDGGSHTPAGSSFRASPESEGKDYSWFKSEKDHILSLYNTVYHNHDYNEFIANGLSKEAVAGILRYTHSHAPGPTDKELCNFLCWRVGSGKWPVFAYNRASLSVERHLSCMADSSEGGDYGCNQAGGNATVVV